MDIVEALASLVLGQFGVVGDEVELGLSVAVPVAAAGFEVLEAIGC